MTVTIEKVDQVLDRVPYASYAEAKEALEQSNGDVLDAIIYLEEKFEKEYDTKKKDFFNLDLGFLDPDKLKSILKKGKDGKEAGEEQDVSTLKADVEEDQAAGEDSFNSYKYHEKQANDNFNYEKIKEQIQDLFNKSGMVRFIIERNGKTLVNIPIVAGVAGVVLVPHFTVIGLSLAVLSKCQIKIMNEEQNEVVDLGEFSEEKFNMVKEILSSSLDKFNRKHDFPDDSEKKADIVDAELVEEDNAVEEGEVKAQDDVSEDITEDKEEK